jgi:hypothetical protein
VLTQNNRLENRRLAAAVAATSIRAISAPGIGESKAIRD